MSMKRFFFIFAALALFVSACDIYPTEEEIAGTASAIQVVSSDIFFPSAGGQGSITVDAKGPVTAVSAAYWCHVEVLDNRHISVTADKAVSNQSRYSQIRLLCGNDETYVVAQQSGFIISAFEIGENVEFAKYGGSVVYPFSADTPMEVTCYDDWVVATVNEDGLTLFVGEYDKFRSTSVRWEIPGYKSGVISVVQDGNWKSLGNCQYTDAFMTAAFNIEDKTYEVEIQKSLVNEGVFRLVNPYGAAYPYNEPGDYDTSKYHYMVIHAEDRDAVTIEEFHSGMDWTYGEFVMTVTKPGKLENKVITFPKSGISLYIPGYGDFAGNKNETAKIDLTGLSY